MVRERPTADPETQPIDDGETLVSLGDALRVFVPNPGKITPLTLEIARAETAEATWVIRRWPPGTTEGRIAFVHDLLRTLRAGGIAEVPEPAALPDGAERIVREGVTHDAERAALGRPLGRARALHVLDGGDHELPATMPAAAVSDLIATIARIHTAGEAMALRHGVPTLPLAAVAASVRGSWEQARQILRPVAPSRPAVQRWIKASERALPAASRDLAVDPDLFRGGAIIGHCHLWPTRFLWARPSDGAESGHRLVAIVDWSNAAATSPLLDLAQIIAHCGGWRDGTAEEAIGTYTAVRQLTPDERRLLPAVAVLDLVAVSNRLLVAAFGGEERRREPEPVLRDAIEMTIASLERAADLTVRGDRRIVTTRRWVHRPPRSGGKPTSPPARPAGNRPTGDRRAGRPPRRTPNREG